MRSATLLLLAVVGCSPLTRPDAGEGGGGTGGAGGGGGTSGGAGGGTSGGAGGGAGPWQEVQLPYGTSTGGVNRLAPRDNETWALVAKQYVYRLRGTVAQDMQSIDPPSFIDLGVTPDASVVVATETELLWCRAGCEVLSHYDQVSAPQIPLSVCVAGEELYAAIPQTNGVRVFVQQGTDWNSIDSLTADNPTQCSALGTTAYVAARGGVATFPTGAAPFVQAVDTTSLGRASAQEEWVSAAKSVNRVYVGSALGGFATGNGITWSVTQAPTTPLTALSAAGDDDVWAVGQRLAHWKSSTWSSEPLPSPLVIGTAVALQGDGTLVVGGRDADGGARVFFRAR